MTAQPDSSDQQQRPASLSRRTFLGKTLVSAGVLAAPTIVPAQVIGGIGGPGANERVHIAIVGMGRRGQNLIGNLPSNARLAAICDCAHSRLVDSYSPKGKFIPILAPWLASSDAQHCKKFHDVRRMIDSEKLDAVMVTTPDHNHAFVAMLALQANLDVYLEKPLTLTIGEGRALVDAVKRQKRILQVGSQNRSMELNQFAYKFIRDGRLGKISHVNMPNYAGPLRYRELGEEGIPSGLDWDLFCGPRPLRSYNRRLWVKDEFKVGSLLWRGWDLWRDYSGHLMTNWGAHSLDMVQHALGRDLSGPVEIRPERPKDPATIGEEYSYVTPLSPLLGRGGDDNRRFWALTMRYADGIEIRFRPKVRWWEFHGEHGTLFMRRNHFRTDPPDLVQDGPDPQVAEKWRGFGHVARPHIDNWLDCIKTRGTPNAPVEAGHRSNSICLLGNIARELARPLRWEPTTERFFDDPEADRLLDRPRRPGFELPAV